MKSMKWRMAGWILLPLSSLVGCGSLQSGGHETKSGMAQCGFEVTSPQEGAERWNCFSHDVVASASVDKAQAVFIRKSDAIGPAVNVYVNGEYVTSLLPGAWQQSSICAGLNHINAELTDGTGRYNGKQVVSGVQSAYDTPAGQVSYFRVEPGQGGGYKLSTMSAIEAQALVEHLPRQSHTLTRVDRLQNCAVSVAEPAPMVVPEPRVEPVQQKFSLQAGALFAYNKSDYDSLLPQGRKEIADIATQVKGGASIDRVDVIGYTDPEGGDNYNLALSLARAQTVARVLIENGLPADRIEAVGRGESQLIDGDCKLRYPKQGSARNACNQVNRRVEIVLRGVH